MPTVVSRLLPGTVRGRVSAILNGTLFILFLLFLGYDYRSDAADRLELQRHALEEQARILTSGVRSKQGRDDLLAYLEEARRQMEETHSDSHVVAVDVNNDFIQSGMPEGDESVAASLRNSEAGDSSVQDMGGKSFLVGSHRDGATAVYVAEDLQDIQAAIRADLQRHLAAVGITLLLGIGIINGVLWLVFQRPLAVLTDAVEKIGSGNLGLQINRIGTKEFDILATAINEMSRTLNDVESTRVAQMHKARVIQESLLPAQMTLSGVAIAHNFQPAETVGGDYYDLLTLPDGSGLFCIADATGHGVSAALVAAMVKVCLLNAVDHSSDPSEILGFVDRRLSAMNLPGMFVSMLLIRHRQDVPDLEFAGAGHPSALLVDENSRYRELISQGPLLGIGADLKWTTKRERFSPGDRLVLYTDGVTEAADREQRLFGAERLREIINSTRSSRPTRAVQEIARHLKEYL